MSLLAAVAAGCGGGSDAAGSFTPATPGTLTVATADVPTPGFWEGTAAHLTGGFEYALAHRLADRFGLGSVRVIVRSFAQITSGELGGADLALAQVTPTDARDEHLDFSTPYLDAPPGVLVRTGTDVPDLETARDLSWSVEQGTTLVDDLDSQIRPYQAPLVTSDQTAAVTALRDGGVDAVLLDLPTALAYAQASSGAFEVASQLPSQSTLAAALPQGSSNLEAVSSQIKALQAKGELDALAERWLGTSLDGMSVEAVPLLRTTL